MSGKTSWWTKYKKVSQGADQAGNIKPARAKPGISTLDRINHGEKEVQKKTYL